MEVYSGYLFTRCETSLRIQRWCFFSVQYVLQHAKGHYQELQGSNNIQSLFSCGVVFHCIYVLVLHGDFVFFCIIVAIYCVVVLHCIIIVVIHHVVVSTVLFFFTVLLFSTVLLLLFFTVLLFSIVVVASWYITLQCSCPSCYCS